MEISWIVKTSREKKTMHVVIRNTCDNSLIQHCVHIYNIYQALGTKVTGRSTTLEELWVCSSVGCVTQ